MNHKKSALHTQDEDGNTPLHVLFFGISSACIILAFFLGIGGCIYLDQTSRAHESTTTKSK